MALLDLSAERLSRSLISVGNAEVLRRFRRKVAAGQPVVYGAIGGSITEGAVSGEPPLCYVSRLGREISLRTSCRVVNAGIGATGSRFGTFRCAEELLCHHPDLITVDFAVNDADVPASAVSYEALIRRLCELAPDALIVLLFMLKRDGTNVQHLEIPIGRHYNLAMLSYRDFVWPDLEAGNLAWEQISPDDIHPNAAGHELLAAMIAAFLFDHDLPARELPPPLEPEVADYEGGVILRPETLSVTANTGWKIIPSERGHNCYSCSTPGAELEFRFSGRNLAIGYRKYAGEYGHAELSIDGKEPVVLEGFFEMPPGGTWRGGHIFPQPVACHLAPGEHVGRLRLLTERHPESTGNRFDFEYLLNS